MPLVYDELRRTAPRFSQYELYVMLCGGERKLLLDFSKQFEEENRKKQLVADLSLDKRTLQTLFRESSKARLQKVAESGASGGVSGERA